MKFLYWNIKLNSNLENIIIDCICENSVDIAVFSEFENLDFKTLIQNLNDNYQLLDSFGGCEKVKVLFHRNIQLTLLKEQHRYLLAKISHLDKIYLLACAHLPSNTHSNSDDRKIEIRKIINDISFYEANKIFSSIVIGDMNASPFDTEMIGKDSFNSVLFKDVIRRSDQITYHNEKYRRFYNPIIEYINEGTKSYGSFYYQAGNSCLYWYCYDQILVRKELIDNILKFDYLKQIKNTRLLKNNKPNKKISDHLPLLVELDI